MAESIIRGKRQGFTVLYNSVLMDNRLDLKTKGLFAIVQSFPEDWEYSVSGLAARVGIGRDSIRGCLRQLEDAGYLLREQPHGAHGHFARTAFVFQEQAPAQKSPLTEKPSTVKPSTAEPSPVNPTQVNKHLSKETKEKAPIPPAREFVKDLPPDICRRILEYAPNDTGLQQAILDLLENRSVANKKPVKTMRAMDGILRDLDKHSGGQRDLKLRLLDKAIKCNWLTVYKLKPDEMPLTTPVSDGSEEGEIDGI